MISSHKCFFSVSSLISLASIQNLECIVGGTTGILGQHAQEHKFQAQWGIRGMKAMVWIMLVWSCRVGTSILKLYASEEAISLYATCRCAVSIFGAGLHLVIVHSACHTLTFLELMLHAYRFQYQGIDEWARGVRAWNLVQAILRRLSTRIGSCFLAKQTSATVVILIYAARILDMVTTKSDDTLLSRSVPSMLELPSLMMALASFVLFVKAAVVTETCVGIPPAINSKIVTDESAINHDRQYLVQYVLHSQAGFYVKGSRIDATMLMNYCYLCGAIVCGLFTTGLSMSRKQ